MTIQCIARDEAGRPTMYKSSAVYTIVDGKRTLANPGFIAQTLEEIVALVQHAECSFSSIWVKEDSKCQHLRIDGDGEIVYCKDCGMIL